ncbi:hypothetical protein LUX12_16050 [Streptomyces somaliensis]|uniref:hypothetical protein n=1 Tax=Streptomyces somaliensis TaxID=78355 RepID=UPI0020CCA306|nr:hypothetical protein [Streptomyces somaliensis]MCP9945963.1 hypothetical protein [Streptomyces somaliensis]MCP9960866.1 hypothetical protein [Streptomyces somaliensis]MCP9973652.1 hypothetical protein [Streptomyces somaliensis]
MKTAIHLRGTCVALLLTVAVTPAASATEQPNPEGSSPVETMSVDGIKVDADASAETKRVIESDIGVAAAAANVCGSGYTISTGAARYGTYGTTYTWTNGKTTGDTYYDKPICAVFFNDTGSAHYMGIRLKTNYTEVAEVQDFGTFSTYAGPVYQSRGYCGKAYSYMKVGSKVVVDNYLGIGSCN